MVLTRGRLGAVFGPCAKLGSLYPFLALVLDNIALKKELPLKSHINNYLI